MNTRFIRSIILPFGLISTLFLGMLPISFAPAKAQANNTLVGRFSKYSSIKAPFLASGSRGQAVRDVQAALQRLGFYRGAIDGIYGPRTSTAVAAFQRSHRIVGDGSSYLAPNEKTRTKPIREDKTITTIQLLFLRI